MQNEYNFDADAEKTFSGLMDSVRGAGSATALLGAAGFMAFAAELATHKSPLLCVTLTLTTAGCMHCQPPVSACIRLMEPWPRRASRPIRRADVLATPTLFRC